MKNSLYSLLGIPPGITAFVGAGGKTSAIFIVCRELRQRGFSVAVTTTTHMFPPPEEVFGPLLLSPSKDAVCRAAMWGICAAGGKIDERGKLTGISEEGLLLLQEHFDYVLVEADGSRRLPCKMPDEKEPVIPKDAGAVVGVLGMSALGKPMKEICFRPELAAEKLHVPIDSPITPTLLSEMALSPEGLQKGVEGHPFSLLINQRELCQKEALETARLCKACMDGAVVTASILLREWEAL